MTGLAFFLVIVAAFVHASWNLLTKRVNASGPALVWLFSTLTVLIYFPINLWFVLDQRPQLDGVALIFMLGTFVLHLAYFLLLQRGYRVGDLSVVYPLARGTGPTLSTIAAILFLGENPAAWALVGAGLVILGVFLLSGGVRALRGQHVSRALVFGLLIGCIIASYTIWDKIAVSMILVPPLILDYSSAVGRAVVLAPLALRPSRREEVRQLWQSHRWSVIGIALLNPLSYILILTAMTFAPVSYIAPARESSVLIAVLMGVFLLKEGQLRRRLSAASIIVVGVALLALN